MNSEIIDEAVVKLLDKPKSVEVDGQRVENQSIGDVLQLARYLASQKAAKSRTPLRITKMAAGGAAL
ncbi:MAG: hypothetical protein ACI4RA_10950 [Kiritimatiellia bacterium]